MICGGGLGMKGGNNYRKDSWEGWSFEWAGRVLDQLIFPVHPKIFELMIGYPILIKAFLVLRLKIHKKDKLYNFLIKGIKKYFSIALSKVFFYSSFYCSMLTNIFVNIMDFIYKWRVSIESNLWFIPVLGILWMTL